MKRIIGISVAVLCGVWLFAALSWNFAGHATLFQRDPDADVPVRGTEAAFDSESAPESEESGEKGALTLVFAGDIMLARAIEATVQNAGGGDYDYLFARIGNLASSADIAFANLETSVSVRGANVGSIYSFRSNPEALAAVRDAGFDVVSVANNHIWDWGKTAFLDTLAHLDEYGIEHAGGGADYAAAHKAALIERNGVTVGFLAYTNLLPQFLLGADAAPAVAFPTEASIAADVAQAKRDGADIVVASFHWGIEYDAHHNEYQDRLAHAAIDAGALIVAGHHPHTPQEIETYKGGLIIYSLGNFIFDQNFDESTRKGLVVRATVDNGKIVNVESINVRFTPTYQPYVAE